MKLLSLFYFIAQLQQIMIKKKNNMQCIMYFKSGTNSLLKKKKCLPFPLLEFQTVGLKEMHNNVLLC